MRVTCISHISDPPDEKQKTFFRVFSQIREARKPFGQSANFVYTLKMTFHLKSMFFIKTISQGLCSAYDEALRIERVFEEAAQFFRDYKPFSYRVDWALLVGTKILKRAKVVV